MPVVIHRLAYTPPLAWDVARAWFAARAIPGVEEVTATTYRRCLRDGERAFVIEVRHAGNAPALDVTLDAAAPGDVQSCLARVAHVFDLATDPAPIERHLRGDPLLARCVDARPGLRPIRAWDPFELAVRAVLGQQVSVAAARGLAARLVALVDHRVPAAGALTHVFPGPDELLATDLSTLGMPRARRATLHAIAAAVREDPTLLAPTGEADAAVARWCRIRGIGPWTAEYIALRALGAADAFPGSDIGLLRAAAEAGVRPSPAALAARAEGWRPWRGYAAQHLWAAEPADA
ncbi:MAG: DNA-3-methyladenine glycosylase [Gammaproteobacteria bacterium]